MTEPSIYIFTSTSASNNGRPYWFAFEHENDIDAITDRIVEDGVIAVSKIEARDDGEGGRMITGRSRAMIGINAVATIMPATIRYREAD